MRLIFHSGFQLKWSGSHRWDARSQRLGDRRSTGGNTVRISQSQIVFLVGMLLIGHLVSSAQAELPVQGMPVPELAVFDDIMLDYMDFCSIHTGILGIMKDDRIIYLRSFGYRNEGNTQILPENALMRIASVNKPFTAAAIHHLVRNGEIRLNQRVFTLDPAEDGILDYEPFGGGVGDTRLKDIRVIDLLRHRGGWDRDIGRRSDLQGGQDRL